MTIGSKTIASLPIAGQYGSIDAEQTSATIEQTVEFQQIDAARQVAQIQQDVGLIDPARQVATIRQIVRQAGTAVSTGVPAAYVTVGGIDYTATTALDTVVVNHAEDQASSANVFVFFADGALIDIPSFHGKTLEISTHTNPQDINSEIIPLFTGWVETAKYDRVRRGIALTGSDLRDERLGRENAQEIKQLTGGLYSNYTQREEAEGREYITELMKTVNGSLGYKRDGSLLFYNWGTTGGVDAVYGDADVAYDDIEVEFQTRSSIVNRVKVNIDYRYDKLRVLETSVRAYKQRKFPVYEGSIEGFPNFTDIEYYDGRAFRQNDLIDTFRNNFSPWELIDYKIYPLEKYEAGRSIVIDTAWTPRGREVFCQGIAARMNRRLSQPVRESYQMTVVSHQSFDAYGEYIDGSELNYSLDVDFDRTRWEEEVDFEKPLIDGGLASAIKNTIDPTTQLSSSLLSINDISVADATQELRDSVQSEADSLRIDLGDAFDAAYAIAKKEIVASHRKNFVSFKAIQSIRQSNIGDIIQLDTRVIQTTGQVTALSYTIADGIRDTDYTIAVSYMNTTQAAPIENYARPSAPTPPSDNVELVSSAQYDPAQRAFDIEIAEVGEGLTDELEQEVPVNAFEVPVENNSVVLINDY